MTWWGVAAQRPHLVEPLLRFLERNVDNFCYNVVPEARDPAGCGPGSGDVASTLAGPSAHAGYVAVGRIEVGHHDPGGPTHLVEPPGPLGDLVQVLLFSRPPSRFRAYWVMQLVFVFGVRSFIY
jgi:hypothetical protein